MDRLKRAGAPLGAAWLGAWLLGLTAFAVEPPLQFPPPHATVVLMTGLPGDLESETSFREQLGSWLALLQAGGQAERICVLSDSPESVTLSTPRPTQLLKADRTTFLELGKTLEGQTNPLVVIAWGHGGRQGQNPVFHVRGPRLTPADFQTFAGKARNRPSYWLLLFRESGSFARPLADEQRWIVSSECDSPFASDPIGMALWVRLAKANSGGNFMRLSEAFGRATDSWYNERNLARTEEPTLWAEKTKPRLLAAPTAEVSDAPVKTTTKAGSPLAPGMENPVIATNLSAAWKPIHRIDPKRFPNADGVTLRRRLSHTFGSSPAVATEQEEFIQILTAEGKRLADFDFSYSPPFEDMVFLDCEVLRLDGKLTRLDPDAIREAGSESVGGYQSGRRKFFSLPGAGPGAVLHVHYRTQWKDFPLPHVSMEVPIDLDLPALETTVEVSLPKASPFHFALEGISGTDPTISQSTYGASYAWRFDNLPARAQELLSSPRRHPRLLLSTFPDWQAFAEWYDRITKLADEVTPDLEARVVELTRDAKTEREKVLALYNYVTALRYVAVPLGVNSFRPHAAAHVLKNQFGDCKDKANLLNTFLHTLNIEAHLALVPRFSQAQDAIPGLSFNHAISRVTLNGQTVWVDTTDDVCRFGLLPPGDPGRRVLVIDGHTDSLTLLPVPEPNQHRLTLKGEIDCTGAADALSTTLQVIGSGYQDYELRGAARETKDHGSSFPLLSVRFRPTAGSFALERQSATAASALDEDFSWRAEGSYAGLAAANPGKWVVHAPFWLPKEWDYALHHRETPLFLNQGYPLGLDQEFVFNRPPNAGPPLLPAAIENVKDPLRWRVEWVKIGDDKLAARLHAELVRGELSSAETSLVQRQIRSLLSALAADATFPTN